MLEDNDVVHLCKGTYGIFNAKVRDYIAGGHAESGASHGLSVLPSFRINLDCLQLPTSASWLQARACALLL